MSFKKIMLHFVRRGSENNEKKWKEIFFSKSKKKSKFCDTVPSILTKCIFKTISEHLMRYSDDLDQFENCGISGI